MTLTNGNSTGGSDFERGGAVFSNLGDVILNDMAITNNVANNDGGGISLRSGDITVNRSTITNNQANGFGQGGGIDADDVIIHESTISGNTSAHDGGGVYADQHAYIYDSTISGNMAGSDGGGMYADRDSEIYRSTISGNTATYGGGGIYVEDDPLLVVQSTITGNTADDQGGGVYNTDDVTLINTILSGNTAFFSDTDAYVDGTFTSTNSLLGTDIFIAATGNVSSDTPNLGPLQDNGGPTFTHLPLAGSPALDAGTASADMYDQRGIGFTRVFNGTVDIGAVERQGVNPLQGGAGQATPVPIFSIPGLIAMIAGFLALSRRRQWVFRLK